MEKRRFTRFPLKTKAKVLVSSKEALLEAETENVSLKGVFVQTGTMLPLHEEVEIELWMPDDPHESKVRTKATVMRHHDKGMGLEFGPMDFEGFFVLQGIISRVSGNPSLAAKEFFNFVNNE
jgi:hypothetical protein